MGLLHPARGSSQKAAPASQNSCQGLNSKTEGSGVPISIATLVHLFQLGWGVVFPDSRSESEGMHSWASVPALGGWKLPEARAQNRAHRMCPGTTLPTRAPL